MSDSQIASDLYRSDYYKSHGPSLMDEDLQPQLSPVPPTSEEGSLKVTAGQLLAHFMTLSGHFVRQRF